MPLITVITAAKNAAPFLPETIESIQAQTERDWNYVIVDDGSDDDTAAIVERYASADSRIELRRLDDSVGPYAAANVGARDVSSKYIARIDGDDVAPPNRFEVQLAVMRAFPGLRACTGAWQALEPSGLDPRVRRVPSPRNQVIKWMLCFRNPLIHSTMLIETTSFLDFGGYGPERVAEDFRMWAALVRANALAVTDDVLVRYRRWSGQITAASDSRDNPARARIWLDHLRQCTASEWTLEEVRELHDVGEPAAFGPERALELLGRFEDAWQNDAELVDADRQELRRFMAKRRLRHLRHAVREQPAAVAFAATRNAGDVLRSFAQVATHRGVSWP